jgi:comEA protein
MPGSVSLLTWRISMRRFPFAVVLAVACALFTGGASAQAQDSTSSRKPKSATALSAPININSATASQLEGLPGIGARTAQLIVEHRQKNGGFKKIEELMNVKGIGEKSFLKLKPMVTVGNDKGERAGEKQ